MSLLHNAYELFQQGNTHEAASLLHSHIKNAPRDDQACYLMGLITLQTGDEKSACTWFRKTIHLSPEATPAHYNLGVLAQNRGEFEAAHRHYQTAANLAPQDLDIRFNLALTCKQLNLLGEAKNHFEAILETKPTDTETLYTLANTEQQLGNTHRAITLLETLTNEEPTHLSALNNLGYLYHKAGNSKQAIPVYKALIKHNHNATAARHLLAAITGKTTSHAPPNYIKDVFDQFADHFDESLQQKLGYNTPTALRTLLDTIQPEGHFAEGLDLGCGTGLSGSTFKDCTSRLTGIDLSPKMLEQAKAKKLYTSVHESDLIPFIQNATTPYDLYIAADVFVYIGDLKPIFAAIAAKGNPTTFIFSTEHAAAEYQLKPTGRYGHAIHYINTLAKQYGFIILTHKSAPIRKEGDGWIDGELYVLKKD